MSNARLSLLLLVAAALLGACGSEQGRALCEAVNTADLEAVEALIAQGADVDETVRFQGNFTTSTRVALSRSGVSDRYAEVALRVIAAGGDPNLSWSFGGGDGSPGSTVYMLAVVAQGGSTEVVEALLAAGASVEGESGGDALVAAARANQVEVLRLLADAGADINFKQQSGDTPLGAAVDAGAREAITFLEDKGASEW